MAFELAPHPHSGILRGRLEATVGGDTTVNDSDTYHWPEDGNFNGLKRTMNRRTSQAGFFSGSRPIKGMAMGMYSAAIALDHLALTGTTVVEPAASIAGVPQADLWLRAGGFVAGYTSNLDYSGLLPDGISASAGLNDRILTYTLKPRSGAALSSAKLQYDVVFEDGSKARRHIITGARHGWVLNFPGGESAVLNVDGKGFATPIGVVTSPVTSSPLPDQEEIVGLASNVSLTSVIDGVTWAKDSATAPATQLRSKSLSIYDLEINSGITVTEKLGPAGIEGVASYRYVYTRPTATFRLDEVPFEDDFDIESFRDRKRIMSYEFVIPNPLAPTTSFTRYAFSGFIMDIEPGTNDGYRDAAITLDLGYPDVSNDGGGLVPTTGLTIQYVTIVAAT